MCMNTISYVQRVLECDPFGGGVQTPLAMNRDSVIGRMKKSIPRDITMHIVVDKSPGVSLLVPLVP